MFLSTSEYKPFIAEFNVPCDIIREETELVNKGVGSISMRKDGKYFLYLPKNMVEDTGFPFIIHSSVKVKVSFSNKKVIVEGLKD
jgi:hypothetical protein